MHDGFGAEEMETDAWSRFLWTRAMPRGPSTEEAATELEFGAAGDTSKSACWTECGIRMARGSVKNGLLFRYYVNRTYHILFTEIPDQKSGLEVWCDDDDAEGCCFQ